MEWPGGPEWAFQGSDTKHSKQFNELRESFTRPIASDGAPRTQGFVVKRVPTHPLKVRLLAGVHRVFKARPTQRYAVERESPEVLIKNVSIHATPIPDVVAFSMQTKDYDSQVLPVSKSKAMRRLESVGEALGFGFERVQLLVVELGQGTSSGVEVIALPREKRIVVGD